MSGSIRKRSSDQLLLNRWIVKSAKEHGEDPGNLHNPLRIQLQPGCLAAGINYAYQYYNTI